MFRSALTRISVSVRGGSAHSSNTALGIPATGFGPQSHGARRKAPLPRVYCGCAAQTAKGKLLTHARRLHARRLCEGFVLTASQSVHALAHTPFLQPCPSYQIWALCTSLGIGAATIVHGAHVQPPRGFYNRGRTTQRRIENVSEWAARLIAQTRSPELCTRTLCSAPVRAPPGRAHDVFCAGRAPYSRSRACASPLRSLCLRPPCLAAPSRTRRGRPGRGARSAAPRRWRRPSTRRSASPPPWRPPARAARPPPR